MTSPDGAENTVMVSGSKIAGQLSAIAADVNTLAQQAWLQGVRAGIHSAAEYIGGIAESPQVLDSPPVVQELLIRLRDEVRLLAFGVRDSDGC